MPIPDRVASLARGCCLFLLVAWALAGAAAQARPTPLILSTEGDSGAGHVRVSWTADEGAVGYELQRATHADFRDGYTLYRGQHTASVLSGLLDGTLYFRVRARFADAMDGPWSEVVSFEVHHHGRDMALAFFLAGACIFAVTLGFLWFFSRRVATDD